MGYSLWGHTESDMTERLSTHAHMTERLSTHAHGVSCAV